jgi:hypothetical protein
MIPRVPAASVIALLYDVRAVTTERTASQIEELAERVRAVGMGRPRGPVKQEGKR